MNEVEKKIENIVGAVYNHGFLTAKEGTDRLLKSPNTEMPIAVAKQELKSLIQEERQGAVMGYAEDCEDRNSHMSRGLSKGVYLKTAEQYLKSLEDKDVLTDGGKNDQDTIPC